MNDKPRPRGRPRQFDQNTALAAATRAFLRRGYAGTSTEALADAMGVLKPSMYAAFGEKAQLFQAALAAWAAEVRSRLLSVMVRARTLPELTHGVLLEATSIYAPAQRGAAWGCLIQSAAGDAVEAVPEVELWLRHFLRTCDEELTHAIEPLTGSWTSSERAIFARCLNAAIRDLAFRARAREGREQLESCAAAHASVLLTFAQAHEPATPRSAAPRRSRSTGTGASGRASGSEKRSK